MNNTRMLTSGDRIRVHLWPTLKLRTRAAVFLHHVVADWSTEKGYTAANGYVKEIFPRFFRIGTVRYPGICEVYIFYRYMNIIDKHSLI